MAEYSIKELLRYSDQQQSTEITDNEKLLSWLIGRCEINKTDRIGYAEAQSRVNPKAYRAKPVFELLTAALAGTGHISVVENDNKRVIVIRLEVLKNKNVKK